MLRLLPLLLVLGCPTPPQPCLPGMAVCPPTPQMEQSCADFGGHLAMMDCAADGSSAWACCVDGGGCTCFEAEK